MRLARSKASRRQQRVNFRRAKERERAGEESEPS